MKSACLSDLPVILPPGRVLAHRGPEGSGGYLLRKPWLAAALLAWVLLFAAAEAYAAPGRPSIVATLLKWTPLIAKGFVFNILISVIAMVMGTVLGLFIGIAQISEVRPVRHSASLVTQFFRNAPWLVLLFYCMLLLPFQIRVGDLVIPLPDWLKAIFGLSVAVAANMSEIARGAIQSIPTAQWESSEALGFQRFQTLWMIILPQCVKRMLPPWMNLYAILLVSTPLCSIVGVNEVVTLTADALAAEDRHDLLVPMYGYILGWFFVFCYPIGRWTVLLERRFAVNA
ncbi:MAG: amino acid ABC transporter permease [Alphaproteobacteria bacterium]|nr:amino acid ABC transporter permease [Alphaproteobacteria bacterium]